MRSFAWMVLATAACGRLGFDDAPLELGEDCAVKEWRIDRIVDELTSNDDDWSPAWGLGQDQVVLESNRNSTSGVTHLYLARLDASTGRYGNVRALDELNMPKGESTPSLSQDGLELFFTRDGEILRATRDSPTGRFGAPKLFQSGAFGPDLGNNDLDLIYTADDNGLPIFVIRSRSKAGLNDFGPPRRLDELALPKHHGWPSLSQDGLELYYEANDEANNPLPTYFTSRPSLTAKFAKPVPLTELGTASDPDISPDGQLLLYVASPSNVIVLARRACTPSRSDR